VDTFSTAGVPRSTRARYWNDVYSNNLAHVSFSPLDQDGFAAELKMGAVGPLGIARVHSGPTQIERTNAHIARAKSRRFSFVLQVRGVGTFTHCGHETLLKEGDFTLCDSSAPHTLRFAGPADFILLRASPETLKTHFPVPERVCGLRLPSHQGFTNAAAVMTRSLWDQMERGLPARFNTMIVSNVLDMMASSYAIVFDPWISETSAVAARRMQVKRFIDAHLREPGLSPGSIAEALHISRRYLRMMFSGDEETVSAYILRSRLEEAAKQIANVLWRGRTLANIAYACGFTSAAHFTRVFHAHFGMTPRQYREAHLRAGAEPP
jgi:AraC family transcriptional regulator, positive regulator of tynA and feaB